jgi:hypothetical protein
VLYRTGSIRNLLYKLHGPVGISAGLVLPGENHYATVTEGGCGWISLGRGVGKRTRTMSGKGHTEEQSVGVLTTGGSGALVGEVCRKVGMSGHRAAGNAQYRAVSTVTVAVSARRRPIGRLADGCSTCR